jgi:TonB-linked SusC/RagA family outer membrane protein
MKFLKHPNGAHQKHWLVKSLVIMKLTIIILLISCMQVRAKGYSQAITLNLKSVELRKALNTVEKHTNFRFLYSERKMADGDKVSINVTNADISQVMNQLLSGTSLSYKTLGNNLIVLVQKDEEVQDVVVTGKVTDKATGLPIAGASIQIKGSNAGTTTDGNGNYSINVPERATLVISSIGYNNLEIPVQGRSVINVTLEVSTTGLNEVVVTALGITRASKALGYAVQKVGGNEIQTVKGVVVGTSLSGKVSGLVIKNSTEFDATPTIELRGESPMLVIDGVPYSNLTLRDIPTDNIADISVLKGPTAAALYGAKGASGAIMITTKKGKGKGLSIDLNSNTMVALGYLALPKVQTSYGHGIDGQISTDYVWGPKLDIGDSAMQWNPVSKQTEMMPLVSSGKNNLKNFLETGLITNNNISVMQSGENGYFRAGINHIYNKGQFPNEHLNIINYTMSGALKVGDKFNIESHMGYTWQKSPQIWGRGYGAQGYLYQILMWTGPDYDIRQYRDYWVTPNEKQNWLYTAWYDNPYLIAYEKLDGVVRNKLNASLTANYQFTKELSLMFRTGYDFYKNEETVQSPAGINSTRGGSSGNTFGWNYSGKGMFGMNQLWGFSTNNDLILTYDKKINQFDVNVLGGSSISYFTDREFGSQTRNGLAVPGWYSLANAVPSTTAGVDALRTNYGTWSEQVNSLYGKASLGWNTTVFLDLTGRNDWSSTQSASQRSYFYPSISSSVIVSKFIPMPAYVDMWKLRGSWTQDKLPAGIYDNNRTFSGGTSWGLPSSTYPGNLLGKDLLPSSTRTWEVGTEAYLASGRLHFDVAYFNKYYYDQQTSATISSASGFSSTLINTKETYARRGLEVTVDGSVIKNKDFEWRSMINYSFQHRYYINLDPVYSADNLWTKKGARLDAYISEPLLRDPKGQLINDGGFPVLSDYYGNLGYTDPKFSFGFINNFTIKDFIIGVSIDGRIGGIMYDYIWNKMFDTGANPETDTKWRYDQVVLGLINYVGPGVKVVSGEAKYDKYGRITSDTRKYATNDVAVGYQDYEQWLNGAGYEHGLKNQSFIKLREISVGYNFPKRLLGKTGIKNATLSLTAQNVLMWTKFTFSDPDLGDENLNAPSQRLLGLNIKLGF